MYASEGQGQGSTQPPPPTSDLTSFQVSKADVLQKRSALLQEGLDLRQFLRSRQYAVAMPVLGGDPVSKDASLAYTNKLVSNPDSLWMRCMEYAENLIKTGDALAETAKSYGYTEDEIANSFKDHRV